MLTEDANGKLAQDANLTWDGTTLAVAGRIGAGGATFPTSETKLAIKTTTANCFGYFESTAGNVQFANFGGEAFMQGASSHGCQLYSGAGVLGFAVLSDATCKASSALAVGANVTSGAAITSGGPLVVTIPGANHYMMNSAGTFYGTLQNDSANTFSLGYAIAPLTLGTPVIQWVAGASPRIGLNGNTPVAKGVIAGSRSDGSALASLITFLATRGDATDNTTP